ncbi:MAG: hypothetical protein KGZ82_01530 [Bacteroidales bacterium]|nr:hypothetical protein [Bacteroidales bacterium]
MSDKNTNHMKHGNIFWGVVLIVIGFLFLFDKLGMLDFQWSLFWRLWPVLLILWGISIIPMRGIFKIMLALVVGALSIGFYYQQAGKGDNNRSASRFWLYDNSRNDGDENRYSDQAFSAEMPDSISVASLKMDAAAGDFRLEGPCENLFEFSKSGQSVNYTYRVEEFAGKASVFITQESDFHLGRKNRNEVNLQLNPSPLWDIDVEIGAADFSFDLSGFKVRKLDIDGGATSIDLVFGNLCDSTNVSISAAASSIDLVIPENSGCRIEGSSVLSSRDLEGFDKIEKGRYETKGFAEATPKIYINIDAAVSSFSVRRK